MPFTYTYTNAVSHVAFFVKNMPVTNVQVVACDTIQSIIWCAYPWSWTLTANTTVTLSDGVQDFAGINADFMKMVRARITRTDTTPDLYNELLIVKWLPPELSTKLGWNDLTSVCYEATLAKLRLNATIALPSGVTARLDYEYQKSPTKVTSLATTLPCPDHYFDVVVAGLTWQFYKFADDPRAGTLVADRMGSVRASGAMGEFYDLLHWMRESEDWGAGDTIFPDNPLGGYRVGPPGLFGM